MKSVTPIPKEPVVTIPVDKILNKFDVRVALDQDRVIQFAGMYESNVYLPPIRVIQLDEDTYAFIDGRHRAAAKQYLNLPTIDAVIVNESNPIELYIQALQANWGGAKPPSRDDIVHTIVRMLEAGATQIELKEKLDFLPVGSCRAYIVGAKSVINRRRLSKALDAISEGATVKEAAEQFKLKPELLKDVVTGKKGKWGKSRTSEVQRSVELKAYISRQLKAANNGIAKKMQDLLTQVDSGEISIKIAEGVIKAWEDHLRKTGLRMADWKARLLSIATEIAVAAPGEIEHKASETEQPKAVPKEEKRPRPPKGNPIEFKGTRMVPGFWNEQLPKAIKATGQRQVEVLLDYFQSQGMQFTYKQVDGALQRLKRRGLQ